MSYTRTYNSGFENNQISVGNSSRVFTAQARSMKTQEPKIQIKERHLHQDFAFWSKGLRLGDESPEEIYFLQQHYGMPTRLLDWSNNPMAGLFFAAQSCNKDSGENDAALFMMDAYQLAPEQKARCHTNDGGESFLGIAISANREGGLSPRRR